MWIVFNRLRIESRDEIFCTEYGDEHGGEHANEPSWLHQSTKRTVDKPIS